MKLINSSNILHNSILKEVTLKMKESIPQSEEIK